MRRWLIAMLAYLVMLGGVFAWRLMLELRTPYLAPATPEQQVFVEIPRGSKPPGIARMLQSAGVIRRELPILLYLRWSGSAQRLQAGEYLFDRPASPIEVANRIAAGDIHFVAVTVPEGLTAAESIELIAGRGLGDSAELSAAVRRTDWIADLDPEARSLEGYLFPETYRFPRRVDSEEIIRAMVLQFRERFGQLLRQADSGSHRKVRDVVILASLVEKEAQNNEERGLVASVLSNRLKRRIPLACDPTIIYALKLRGEYDGNLRKSHLSMESPYNTYIHPGLPPSPIANPGESALRAALSPPDSPYLYYVSRNDGTHHFAADFRSHQRAVDRYQKKKTP